jgi:hypothetical protein
MTMTNQTFRRKLVWSAQAAFVALALTLGLGAGTGAFAQTAHKEPKPKKETDIQAAGQKGDLKDDDETLKNAMKKDYDRSSTEGLKATYFADGTIMMELPDTFSEVSVIKINPDGSKSMECVTGMKAAEERLKAQGAPAKADSTPGASTAKPAQKAIVPPVKGETGKASQKTSDDKSKWEVM